MVVALYQIVCISYPSPVHGFLNADLGLPESWRAHHCYSSVGPRVLDDGFETACTQFISYLLSFAVVSVDLRKREGLDSKCTSQCAMVLICRFFIFVGAFDSWMALHSSNVSVDVLQQLCTSRCAMTLRLRCDSIVEFIFKAHFVRSGKASPPLVYFDCAIVLLCKLASFSSLGGFCSSP